MDNEENGDSSIVGVFSNIWTDYKLPIILAIVSLGFIGVSIALIFKQVFTVKPIEFSRTSETGASDSAKSSIFIDIEGGVVNPGVYELPFASRIEDALVKAGGLSKVADLDSIAKSLNRAARVGDGMKLYIPVLTNDTQTSHNNSFATSSNAKADNIVQNESQIESQNIVSNNSISINNASESELDTLPGIGPVTSNKIISGRPYNRIEDILDRKIVNKSVWEKIKTLITL
jgi:competence protein ComEA